LDTIGYFNLVLHAHLPYVLSHGKWPHGMDWIFEAAAETYIPIICFSRDMAENGAAPHFSIDVSPVLAEQLNDGEFKSGLLDYLNQKIDAAVEDRKYFTKIKSPAAEQAAYWCDHYSYLKKTFQSMNCDLIGAFRALEEMGALEIFTCGATHGYFPLLGKDWDVSGQIKTAVETHRRLFHSHPKGIWLPECAYRPAYSWTNPVGDMNKTERRGVEDLLALHGLEYFIVDSHLLKGGKNAGVYLSRFKALQDLWKQFENQYIPLEEKSERSPYQPHLAAGTYHARSPVAFFTRDPQTGVQVWSGEHGYPGDGRYLDFHKKHFPGGHRYWKVTGPKIDLGEKQVYLKSDADQAVLTHARHFAGMIAEFLVNHKNETGSPGVLTAPFDAELFGHWWFEGPGFLQELYRLLPEFGIQPSTCSDALKSHPPQQVIELPEGSWGEGGFHYIWLNKSTEWTWKKLYELEGRIEPVLDALRSGENHDSTYIRIVNQILRELLLASASDWQFLISTWSARDYAELRFAEHAKNCSKLLEIIGLIDSGTAVSEADLEFLGYCEDRDRLFADLSWEWFTLNSAE
jgi:1,4-alpha-glucan branching enzyme